MYFNRERLQLEIVHSLIGSPKPRSKLLNCTGFGLFNGSHQQLPDTLSTQLLDGVATRKNVAGSTKANYVLKDEFWGESVRGEFNGGLPQHSCHVDSYRTMCH